VKDDMKDVYGKNFQDIDNNYLNLIIALFTIGKVPNWMLEFLLKDSFVKKNIKVPKQLFNFVILLGYTRRGLNLLLKGDPHSVSRHVTMVKTRTNILNKGI
jgi:hypothetical protein